MGREPHVQLRDLTRREAGPCSVCVEHGKTWAVLAVALGHAAAAKHARDLGVISETLAPKGYAREDFKGKVAHKLDAERIKQMTDFVEEARQTLHIPGVAMSLIEAGKVVFEGGFGCAS